VISVLIVDDHLVVRDGLRGILDYDTDADVVPAIEAGATGYLLRCWP
jgi:DNA-binding NarL/FixJ family response regulator